MTACAGVLVKKTDVDPALLECEEEPDIPPSPVTNRQDARYKNDLRYAGADCRSKLNRVREVVQYKG